MALMKWEIAMRKPPKYSFAKGEKPLFKGKSLEGELPPYLFSNSGILLGKFFELFLMFTMYIFIVNSSNLMVLKLICVKVIDESNNSTVKVKGITK